MARTWLVSILVLLSGAAALVYQVAWFRELRLVFGASTPANAAVLAIFMGGLGLGSAILGRRADRTASPLMLLGNLELGIGVLAAASPALLWLVRIIYLASGGTAVLGTQLAVILRLLLAAVVLIGPAFLMGGTLAAAARATTTTDDRRRHRTALLYGINTLGSVLGAFAATFVLLEVLGTNRTILTGASVSLLLGVGARVLSRRTLGPAPAREPGRSGPWLNRANLPALAVAGLAGFVFLLMELVWYRMLAPLLGGSLYTFGLTLGVILLGIGLGGLGFMLWPHARPVTLVTLAGTCALEALALLVPFALGDTLALVAIALRGLDILGFGGLTIGWIVIAAIVVLPASLVAGWQFPAIVALLGQGERRLGRDVGSALAINTLGAVGGTLAGGFGLLPAVGALGLWRGAALALLGGAGMALFAARPQLRLAAPVALTAVVAASLLWAPGPSALWRMSGIGAGRFSQASRADPRMENRRRALRNAVLWDEDGRESHIGLIKGEALELVVNGKTDGSALRDAPTQVVSGLLGYLAHPAARTALVIGLGTGSTAGWLADAPGIERVEVVELEPAVVRAAASFAAVSRDVLNHPRVRVIIGDAREVVTTSSATYDLIVSEPSNPFRAGIASLLTREFYSAAARRLNEGGIFVQWMQAYDIDPTTLQSVYATLGSAFPYVETWHTGPPDLVLVASVAPISIAPDELRRRVNEPIVREALAVAWDAHGFEDLLAHYVANAEFAHRVHAGAATLLNLDDRMVAEFGFARTVGIPFAGVSVRHLRDAARVRQEHRPPWSDETVDETRLEEARCRLAIRHGNDDCVESELTADAMTRLRAVRAFLAGRAAEAARIWLTQPEPPRTRTEAVAATLGLAELGDSRAQTLAAHLEQLSPADARVVRALNASRGQRYAEAGDELSRFFVELRRDPWPMRDLTVAALSLASTVVVADPTQADRLFSALREPFAVLALDAMRLETALFIAKASSQPSSCVDLLSPLEPRVPWSEASLSARLMCYIHAGHALAAAAQRDLATFASQEFQPFALE